MTQALRTKQQRARGTYFYIIARKNRYPSHHGKRIHVHYIFSTSLVPRKCASIISVDITGGYQNNTKNYRTDRTSSHEFKQNEKQLSQSPPLVICAVHSWKVFFNTTKTFTQSYIMSLVSWNKIQLFSKWLKTMYPISAWKKSSSGFHIRIP